MKHAVVSAIIVAALTGYVGYQNIYLPTQRQLKRLSTELEEARATQELRAQVAQSLERFERLRKQLPSDANMDWLLHEVMQRAEAEHIQFQSILPQDRRELRDASQVSVHLQLSASYHQLGKFLSALESSVPYLWIDEFSIARNGAEPPQIRLIVSTLAVPPAASAR